MIEIYCGDGKGKTTAAAGLAIRAAGHGIPVLFIQFLKDGTSGEVRILRELSGVEVLCADCFFGFTNQMDESQSVQLRSSYARLLDQAQRWISSGPDKRQVVILDEIIYACNKGFVEESRLVRLLDECPKDTELLLTGRSPSKELQKRADYISRIKKERHPYDRGIPAREGIEW